MKKINVLLSSYNGEKYIREQIESILGQTYGDVTLYVRDDGSTDGTIDILREYEGQGRLILEQGTNVGFIDSFLWLVENCGGADYYAFSDQDDVWLPNKLAMAVEKLQEAEARYDSQGRTGELCEVPLLYFSNYDFYDEELNFIEHAASEDEERHPSFRNSLVDCLPLGFNQVFNNAARSEVAQRIPKHCCGHDWWMYTVTQGLGHVIYDKRVTVKYRRTGNNVSAGGLKFIEFQIWRIKKFIVNGYFGNIRKMLAEYWHLYHSRLSKEDEKLLSLFVRKGYNPIVALKKAFYPKRFRVGIVDELMLRFFFLIGVL